MRSCLIIFLFFYFSIFLEMPPKVGLGVPGEDKRAAQVPNTYIYYLTVMT